MTMSTMGKLEAALDTLAELKDQLDGSGGKDKVTKTDLEAKFKNAARAVVIAYRENGPIVPTA